MKMIKHNALLRLLLVALVLCLMLPLFAACGEPEGTPNTDDKQDQPGQSDQPNQPNQPGQNTPDKDDPTQDVPGKDDPEDPADIYDVPDSLPESANYGTTFTILYLHEKFAAEFWVDANTGGVIDNAVYSAICSTEERFGVDIVAVASGAGSEIDHISNIRNQINGGMPDFDMARGHDVQGANLSLEGSLLDLYSIDALDFTKPWWPQNTINSLTFMGQMYLISSSISYKGLSSTSALFFNKDLMDDHGYDLPYEQVQSGDWYLEDMLSSVEDFHLEGDSGVEGKSEDDTFGIVIPWQLYAWQESFGIELVQKDADTGELVLNGHDERVYDLIDLLYGVCWENDGGYMIERTRAKMVFGEGRALYIPVDLGAAVTDFLNYDVDYGIIPYPKLDETQEKYYSGYTDRYFFIPFNCPDKEYVGTILESMSAEGYRQVTPAYFEVALKNRYTKDETSKEMVDLIKQSMILDFAYVYGADQWWSRSLYHLISGNGKEASTDYASYYKEMLPKAEARVELVTKAFQEMGED